MQKVSCMGNGEITEFYFNFPYFENTNIVVTKNNTPATGYTIVGTSAGLNADIPYVGGKVVFDIPPTALDSITIARQLPLVRMIDYQQTVKPESETMNQDANYLMEVIKDRKDEIDELYEQYSEIADKESTSVLLARIDELNQQIMDLECEIQNGKVMSKDDFFSYTANCITEIPQNIKLELSNDTLILKAGSKIIAPNGKTKIITADQSGTLTTDGQYMVFVAMSNGAFQSDVNCSVSQCGSGDLLPTDGAVYKRFLNITDNKIYRWTSSGWREWEVSLPIAIVTVSDGAISSIDQVFNGFGYIGGTIFALPGISGLIPNGRNDDGTLKNRKFTVSGILTQTLMGGNFSERNIILNSTTLAFSASAAYDATNNIVTVGTYIMIGSGSAVNGTITSLTTKSVVCFGNTNS